jgi:Protein kinase domain
MPPQMARTAASVAPGSLVLNRYAPVRALGSGGSGSVWLAREVETGRDVALKIVPREGTIGSRAEREAAAASRLRHPRCLRAHALARDAQHVYIVYEYVAGRTMREAMRAGELDDRAVLEAAGQVLEGLAHAHSHGIVHRDVKPANVLLSEGNGVSVKLFDFGLALMHEEEGLTVAGDIPGTLAYISPERLRGEAAGPSADVWGVGVLLWEALAGFHPFWSGTLLDTARAIERGAPSLREHRPDLARPIVSCVDRALSTNPGRRPSAAALARTLRQAGEGLRLRHRPAHARPRKRTLGVPRAALRFSALDLRGARPPRPPSPPAQGLALVQRLVCVAGAGAFAGTATAALPFFPERWPVGIAGVAALLTVLSERAGLAFCLAVPILPLGNYAAGLAVLYAVAALGCLIVTWRTPRAGLVVLLGAAFGPIGALAMLPLASMLLPHRAARAPAVAGAVLVAAAIGGAPHVGRLGIARTDNPLTAWSAIEGAVAARPLVLAEAVALALGAIALPYLRRRGPVAAAAYGLIVASLPLVVDPGSPDVSLLVITALTSAALALEPLATRPRPRSAKRKPVDETTAAILADVRRSAAGHG